jgi:hypothetical protein
MEDDVDIDSKIATNGSTVEYMDMVDRLFQLGVNYDATLAQGFSWDEGVDLFHVFQLLEYLRCMRGILMFAGC